ncbi:MAG: DNA-processing protein DprA [Bacteroidota bacterium]
MDLFARTAPTDADELRALVALSLVPGVGPGRIRSLLAHFGSATEVLAAPPQALARVERVGRKTAQAIARFEGEAEVDEQFERAERIGAALVPLWDARYPSLLRQIYDPPAVLWLRGDLVPQDERAVAIVGTRRATAYGKRVAQDFAFELARRGFTVVSGLAYGIDAAAHRGALDAGGRTLAILGSGVDRIYPAKHKALAEQITGQGGVLSEFGLGASPDAPNFPRRNRIIAGLSLGTFVAEARATGGALITAWMATEQNRAVWAAPAALFSPTGTGTNQLIRKGYATLVTSVDELLEEIEGQLPKVPGAEPTTEAAPAPPVLGGAEKKLYEALTAEPVHLDTLCERAGLDASSALVYLLSLEFKGLVRQLAGKQFFRA